MLGCHESKACLNLRLKRSSDRQCNELWATLPDPQPIKSPRASTWLPDTTRAHLTSSGLIAIGTCSPVRRTYISIRDTGQHAHLKHTCWSSTLNRAHSHPTKPNN